eukprot:361760-Chlamydomonas_euryale.AAC.4
MLWTRHTALIPSQVSDFVWVGRASKIACASKSSCGAPWSPGKCVFSLPCGAAAAAAVSARGGALARPSARASTAAVASSAVASSRASHGAWCAAPRNRCSCRLRTMRSRLARPPADTSADAPTDVDACAHAHRNSASAAAASAAGGTNTEWGVHQGGGASGEVHQAIHWGVLVREQGASGSRCIRAACHSGA